MSLCPEPKNVETLRQLTQTLFKMWSALEPSPSEIIGFLEKIFDAIQTGDQEAIEYTCREECTRQVEKLPIAEMIARREFLILRKDQTYHNMEEFDLLTKNLQSLLMDYTQKHHQRFLYEGRDYLKSL